MQRIISCDWGTSALRLRVVDIDKAIILGEIADGQGISATFELWKQSGKKENERVCFYQSILDEQITKLEKQLKASLQDIALFISGMSSSNIGMLELPYKEIPFSTNGDDLFIRVIEASDDFRHKTFMISGAKTMNDAMRGEETQLIGCLDENDKTDQFFIFPGTHSKHIRVNNGKAVDFKTYMTGEFFDLLSKRSVLANVVEANKNLSDNNNNLKDFEKGVADGLHSNLLHSSFWVRTNYLFDKLSKQENYFYLSGLLIGTELKELISIKTPLTIVSDQLLIRLYSTALQKLGIANVKYLDAGKAIINGHCKIYNLWMSKLNTEHFINTKKQTL